MEFPVFDLHCDTAYALLGSSFRECGSLRSNNHRIDLMRAKQLPGYAQCFACFVSDAENRISPVDLFEREMATILRETEQNSDLISLAYCAQDVCKNYENGKMSSILTIEGPGGFGHDPQLLEDLYQVGFRMTTLSWNEANALTGSHLSGEGLSAKGAEYVKEAQRLGMIVDVSHISAKAFWQIMDMTLAPVIASHSNSAKLCPHSRNLSDDMFLEICKRDGVAGINLYTEFLGKNATLDTVCDHIFHFMELDPDGKHIALGGDLDGCDSLPNGFEHVGDYNKLAQCLLNRGLDSKTVMDIFWNNALGVMERCCM